MISRSSGALRPRRVLAGCALVLLVMSTIPVGGQTELVLVDGRVLSGTDVRRDGGDYVLTLESGDEISLPVQLVESVRLTGSKPEEPEKSSAEEEYYKQNPGLRRAEPETLAGGVPAGPTGLRSGEPRQLAGEAVRSASPSEQLEVLGEPAKFQKGVVDNSWTPTTDWDMDPEKQNNWAPSKWSESIVDNSWEPESAYDADADVLKDSESKFQKGSIDSSWTPTDGFKK